MITNEKPKMDLTRALSWSALSSFEYNKEQWYKKYVLGIEQIKTAELEFGSMIGKRLEIENSFLPMITRQSAMEYGFNVVFDGIPLIGFADSFCDKTFKKLEEYKTGKKKWTQERADEHGQITMYLLMNFITHKIRPDEVQCTIHWMPTQDNGDFSISFIEPIEEKIKQFKTKRTMQQMLEFAQRLKKVYKEMQIYSNNHI